MDIALFKGFPRLIHSYDKDKGYTLGLENYPDIEEDFYISESDVRVLEHGTQEYLKAYEYIKEIM